VTFKALTAVIIKQSCCRADWYKFSKVTQEPAASLLP